MSEKCSNVTKLPLYKIFSRFYRGYSRLAPTMPPSPPTPMEPLLHPPSRRACLVHVIIFCILSDGVDVYLLRAGVDCGHFVDVRDRAATSPLLARRDSTSEGARGSVVGREVFLCCRHADRLTCTRF